MNFLLLNISVTKTIRPRNVFLYTGVESAPVSRTPAAPSLNPAAREGASSPPPPHIPGRDFFFTPRRANQRHAADSSLKRTPAVSPSRSPIYTWGVQHRTSSLLVDLSSAVQRRPREPYAKNTVRNTRDCFQCPSRGWPLDTHRPLCWNRGKSLKWPVDVNVITVKWSDFPRCTFSGCFWKLEGSVLKNGKTVELPTVFLQIFDI